MVVNGRSAREPPMLDCFRYAELNTSLTPPGRGQKLASGSPGLRSAPHGHGLSTTCGKPVGKLCPKDLDEFLGPNQNHSSKQTSSRIVRCVGSAYQLCQRGGRHADGG